MSQFEDKLKELANMAKISLVEIKEPLAHLSGMARTESEIDAQTFAGLLSSSGIKAQAVSRNNRHIIYIG